MRVCRFRRFHGAAGQAAVLAGLFLPEEDQLQGPRVAILSYDLWQRRFGGHTNVLGQSLTVDSYNRRTYTVVGVMPPGFSVSRPMRVLVSVWSGMLIFPQMVHAPSLASGRDARRLHVLARLKPGMSIEQAQAEMNTIQARLKEQYREAPMRLGGCRRTTFGPNAGSQRKAGLAGFVGSGRRCFTDRLRQRR